MTTRTYHIRRRLARSRSTSFRLDTSDRGRGTFCSAPETDIDLAWSDRNRAREFESRVDGETFTAIPCPACLASVASE